MKLFLASFLEKENFGPGAIISICNGTKPKYIDVKRQFTFFIPDKKTIDQYYDLRVKDEKTASEFFVDAYKKQLDDVVQSMFEELSESSEKVSTVRDLLPFKDGDTLCSWEREKFNNYRSILAPYLEKLGYEVVLH